MNGVPSTGWAGTTLSVMAEDGTAAASRNIAHPRTDFSVVRPIGGFLPSKTTMRYVILAYRGTVVKGSSALSTFVSGLTSLVRRLTSLVSALTSLVSVLTNS